jgi:hypothetical protein
LSVSTAETTSAGVAEASTAVDIGLIRVE